MNKYFSLLLAGVFLLASCRFSSRDRVNGNKVYTSEERNVGHFTKVSVYGSMNVYVSQEPYAPVKIEGEENVLPFVELVEEGDELKIRFRKNTNITTHRDVKVYLRAPQYDGFKVYGSGDIFGENLLTNPNKFDLGLTGSGNLRLELDAPEVEAKTTGSGDIYLKGNTKSVDAQTTGSGDLHLEELRAENVNVRSHGSGDAWVYASVKLEASTHGSGDISYRGEAAVESRTAGSGSLRKF